MLLSRLKIQKKQKVGLKKVSGHNNLGRVTVKGKKKHHRTSKVFIDWKSSLKDSFLVGIHHNSLHQGMLYKFFDTKTKTFFFFPAISNYSFLSTVESKKKELGDFNIGDSCNNIGIKKSIYVKAPGTYAKILQRYTSIRNYMLLELPSGEHKLFLKDNKALEGSLLGFSNIYENIKKAGRNRWLGKRPKVRGVAMNPVDHPHGGGEGKTSGGRPSVSPKGHLTKNVPTRKKKKKNSWQILKKC